VLQYCRNTARCVVVCCFAIVATEHGPCHLQGRPSAQAVGCRTPARPRPPADTRSFSHANAFGICGGLLENGIYISVLRFRPRQYHPSGSPQFIYLSSVLCDITISRFYTIVRNNTTMTDFRSSVMLRSAPPTFRDNLSVPCSSFQQSVNSYQSTLFNISFKPETKPKVSDTLPHSSQFSIHLNQISSSWRRRQLAASKRRHKAVYTP
jgi:hypothetical protein